MPPAKRNPSHDYFEHDPLTKNVKCLIDNCGKVLKEHAKNQERHIANKHQNVFEELLQKKEQLSKRKAEEDLKSEAVKKPTYVKVKIDFETLQQGCLEMVTVGGRPFSVVADAGFRKIIDPILDALPDNRAINPHNISELVKEKAIAVRQNIAEEVAGKLISIKADGGSRHGRSVLGVNLQFIQNKKVQIRNLAMQELFTSHTSENLKQEILKILRRFNLGVDNIYTLTTDNAANMVKIPKLMGAEADNFKDGESFFDYEEKNEILSSMDGIDLGHCEGELQIEGGRCVAHTQQLAIEDVMKEMRLKKSIATARELVKKLRTPTIAAHLKLVDKSKPVIDVETRWHSSLNMIESLLDLKDFCKEMEGVDKKFYLPEEEWKKLDDLHRALISSRVATKIFQGEQLLPGDFYSTWMTCKFDTQKAIRSPDDFASKLVAAMTKREDSIFIKPATVTSLFLDPRYNVVLSKEGVKRAQEQIEKISKRLSALKEDASTVVQTLDNAETVAINEPMDEDDLDRLLKLKDAEKLRNPINLDMKDLTQQLKEFTSMSRISKRENILEFWETHKYVWPQLYEVAMVAHAHPVTEVSVERSFSHMAFIFSAYRCSINEEKLQDTLTLRINETFKKV